MDVYSAPSGPNDDWLFMGDSITNISFGYAASNVPTLVNQTDSTRWPQAINAGIGGTGAKPETFPVLDANLLTFPGKYVVLAYGTNNSPSDFQMETLVQKVIAAGKIPVIPHIPWSTQKTSDGPTLNQMIDNLYVQYPQIIPGPDLWASFLNRTDLIPSGDVHPNAAGQAFLRQLWAQKIASINPMSTTPPPTNNAPVGTFDEIRLSDGVIRGWSYDPDATSASNQIHIYIDGAAGAGGTLLTGAATNVLRSDINSAFGITGNHGVEFTIPSQYRNGVSHSVYIYGIDTSNSAVSTLLSGSPKSFTLSTATPIVGDINLDHIVNSIDYSILNSKWFTSDANSDLNHDGLVNAIDFSILNSNWFKTW
jgi:hypothetical protein